MKKIISVILAAVMSLSIIAPSFADQVVKNNKVVTLGVNLSETQEASILRYFGVSKNDVEIIYVNNQQERDFLGAYVPLEKIGDKTFSCAYVVPTTSGGIKVKTANLNWVTCNMIASTLSTCGVTNCQVIAAAPFEVSGTGALTGIIIAYQQASGTPIDEVKVDLANREMIVTANLSDEVGQSNAVAIVNETKYEVIENNVTNVNEINNIVNNISNEYNIDINEDQAQEIADLVAEIAQQDYEIEKLKETLAEVQANVIEDTNAPASVQEEIIERHEEIIEQSEEKAEEKADDASEDDAPDSTVEEEPEENILDNTDASALSDDPTALIESDTMSTVVEQEAAKEELIKENEETTADDSEWDVIYNPSDDTIVPEDNPIDIPVADDWYTPDTPSDVTIPEDDYIDVPSSDDWYTPDANIPEDNTIDTPSEDDWYMPEDNTVEEYIPTDDGYVIEDDVNPVEEKVYTEADLENEMALENEYKQYKELKEEFENMLTEMPDVDEEVMKSITDDILSEIIQLNFEKIMPTALMEDSEPEIAEDVTEDKAEYRREYDEMLEIDDEELLTFIERVEEIIFERISEEMLPEDVEETLYNAMMDKVETVYIPVEETEVTEIPEF